MSRHAIRIEDLSFTYAGADNPSLTGVDLEIEEGEFLILTGPTGCGKSTLCRCLNGLIPHFYPGTFEGDVEVYGTNTRTSKTNQLAKKVGLVFQNPENQLFSLCVENDLAFGPENLGLPRDDTARRVDKALSLMGLEETRDRAPYELSGGQQQRAAIASILTMEPRIMVFDEPTSFLDPKTALEIIETVNDLNKRLGITVILVEHRLDIASKFADEIYVMDKGRIVGKGAPPEIFGRRETYLLGVGVPRVSLLFQLLKDKGFPVKSIPVDVEDAFRLLEDMFDD